LKIYEVFIQMLATFFVVGCIIIIANTLNHFFKIDNHTTMLVVALSYLVQIQGYIFYLLRRPCVAENEKLKSEIMNIKILNDILKDERKNETKRANIYQDESNKFKNRVTELESLLRTEREGNKNKNGF
jgi:hypothetical protein